MSMTAGIPDIERTDGRDAITGEQKQFFLDHGYLILRNVLRGEELRRMQQSMMELVDYGTAEKRSDPDYCYAAGVKTGQPRLRRINYLLGKSYEARVLLGHPFILRSVEKVIGPDLLPTWDSMVMKLPDEGVIVPWHRDAGDEYVCDRHPNFNVDFYLDEADLDTCVWAYPGSHTWTAEEAARITSREGFSTEGAVPLLMQPGDVLFHDILVLHGSPHNTSNKLRRVVYYEFRSCGVETELGPHTPEYIPLKQKVLLKCQELRREAGYIPDGEQPFVYDPPAPWNTVTLKPGEELPTFRYVHGDYWRTGDRVG